MPGQWYFARGGTKFVPFSAARLKELAAGGQIRPLDTVWKEGTEKRVPAAKVEGLFPAAQGRPPTTPARPPSPQPLNPPAAPASATPANADGLELAPGEPPPWEPDPAAASPGPAEEEPPAEEAPPRQPAAKKMRGVGVNGGVLANQDGEVVKFRKKCLRCSYTDASLTTMKIRSGVTRVNYFCPKCRKSQQVEVQGVG